MGQNLNYHKTTLMNSNETSQNSIKEIVIEMTNNFNKIIRRIEVEPKQLQAQYSQNHFRLQSTHRNLLMEPWSYENMYFLVVNKLFKFVNFIIAIIINMNPVVIDRQFR